MLKIEKIGLEDYSYNSYWPPVNNAIEADNTVDEELSEELLNDLYTKHPEIYKNKVIKLLSTIYANYFGYEDSVVRLPNCNKNIEVQLLKNKLILEKIFFTRIIPATRNIDSNIYISPDTTCQYLEKFSVNNKGVNHTFFDYAENDMTKDQWIEFLMLEVVRNEIVDDEVALMVPGLQHAMKQVISSNLWDECGNGKITGFHTTWLRMLLDDLKLWDRLKEYRKDLPWFASLTSHSLTSLLTMFCGQYKAYGHFLVTEGWVCPHFEKMINGMNRVGLKGELTQIYFDRHMKIDPHHTKEMITGIKQMAPQLNKIYLREIIEGAHQAETAGTIMYDNLLRHFNG